MCAAVWAHAAFCECCCLYAGQHGQKHQHHAAAAGMVLPASGQPSAAVPAATHVLYAEVAAARQKAT